MSELEPKHWNRLFVEARTHASWLPRPVEPALLRRLYELVRMGPTSGNSQPLRVAFVTSPEAKARLRPALDAGNVEKTMQAPVTAIAAHDAEFYEKLDRLVPHRPGARQSTAALDAARRERIATQSATLQVGYLIVAARGLGLDCGPMGGFDAARVDAEFFAGSAWRSILLVNLGYGDAGKLFPRAPRLEFDEACRVL